MKEILSKINQYPEFKTEDLLIVDNQTTILVIDDIGNPGKENRIKKCQEFNSSTPDQKILLLNPSEATLKIACELEKYSPDFLLFPGQGATRVNAALVRLSFKTLLPQYQFPCKRLVDNNGQPYGCNLRLSKEFISILRQKESSKIGIVDDVIASGTTLRTVIETIQERTIEIEFEQDPLSCRWPSIQTRGPRLRFRAFSWYALDPKQRDPIFQDLTPSSINDVEQIIVSMCYRGTRGKPACVSLSTLSVNATLRKQYAQKYFSNCSTEFRKLIAMLRRK